MVLLGAQMQGLSSDIKTTSCGGVRQCQTAWSFCQDVLLTECAFWWFGAIIRLHIHVGACLFF